MIFILGLRLLSRREKSEWLRIKQCEGRINMMSERKYVADGFLKKKNSGSINSNLLCASFF
ncbi:hypothetical protein C1N72_17350 [Pantoea ananatis]